jgi:hypothetical protein
MVNHWLHHGPYPLSPLRYWSACGPHLGVSWSGFRSGLGAFMNGVFVVVSRFVGLIINYNLVVRIAFNLVYFAFSLPLWWHDTPIVRVSLLMRLNGSSGLMCFTILWLDTARWLGSLAELLMFLLRFYDWDIINSNVLLIWKQGFSRFNCPVLLPKTCAGTDSLVLHFGFSFLVSDLFLTPQFGNQLFLHWWFTSIAIAT